MLSFYLSLKKSAYYAFPVILTMSSFLFNGLAHAQNKADVREVPALKSIFDQYGVKGTILISDPVKNELLGFNPSRWDSGYLPASTFKIVNSLIGLETGVIDTATIFTWDGKKRRISAWDRDLTLTGAFRVSCVPCYQELARKIGVERMKNWVGKLQYGHMLITQQTLDLFWLEGDSRITPREQVNFLRRLYEERLPLSSKVMKQVKSIMVDEKTEKYTISGKTGWSIRNGNNYGWFVGYLETNGRVYFVATLIEPIFQEQISDFSMARKTITKEAFKMLGLIP